jgi:lactoylglutathione lyase
MVANIATVAIYVTDQDASLSFWTDGVGFTVHRTRPMGPGASWVEVGPAGAASCLVLYPKSMMGDWAERRPSIVFECSDLQSAYDAMRARGVRFVQEPTAMPWGPFAIFIDPEGNQHGLREPMRD